MRDYLVAMTCVLVFFCLLAYMLAIAETTAYSRGFKEGVESVRQQPRTNLSLDHACTAWFFDTNLKAAKARMCSGR